MELDVTHMVEDADEMPLLSGSIAELGDRAGRLTWDNSLAYASEQPLLPTPEAIQAARDYARSFGAWTEEEIGAWSDEDVQALIVQDVASQVREMEHYDTIEEWRSAAEEGQCSGNLYQGDNGRWYFYMGN
jgi:hypothetical protein